MLLSLRVTNVINVAETVTRQSFFNTVKLPVVTTSLQQPVFQNTKSFPVKTLYLDPLVSDHLS